MFIDVHWSGMSLILIGETGEKWAIIWESTLKIRKKLVISVSHKTLALPINILNSAMFLVIFSIAS